MNSKMIAIIAVVAMCGAALVGVGYAYTATFSDNVDSATVSVEYVTATGEDFTVGAATFVYNTVSNKDGVQTYTFNKDDSTAVGWTYSADNKKVTYNVGTVTLKKNGTTLISATIVNNITGKNVKINVEEESTGVYKVIAEYTLPVSGTSSAPSGGSIGGFTITAEYASPAKDASEGTLGTLTFTAA